MDENKQVQSNKGKSALLEEVEFGFGGIILGLIAFLLLLFTLNYFNILSLSTLFPEQLGFLPHRIITEQTSPRQKPKITTPTPAPKLTLSCPLPKEFCSKGKVVDQTEFYAVYFTLPKNTPIYTAISGTLTDQPITEGRPNNEPLLYLRDTNNNEVIYSYFGTVQATFPSKLNSNIQIGAIGDGTFPPFLSLGGANFLFSVKKDGKFIRFEMK